MAAARLAARSSSRSAERASNRQMQGRGFGCALFRSGTRGGRESWQVIPGDGCGDSGRDEAESAAAGRSSEMLSIIISRFQCLVRFINGDRIFLLRGRKSRPKHRFTERRRRGSGPGPGGSGELDRRAARVVLTSWVRDIIWDGLAVVRQVRLAAAVGFSLCCLTLRDI